MTYCPSWRIWEDETLKNEKQKLALWITFNFFKLNFSMSHGRQSVITNGMKLGVQYWPQKLLQERGNRMRIMIDKWDRLTAIVRRPELLYFWFQSGNAVNALCCDAWRDETWNQRTHYHNVHEYELTIRVSPRALWTYRKKKSSFSYSWGDLVEGWMGRNWLLLTHLPDIMGSLKTDSWSIIPRWSVTACENLKPQL
jgi:hypothetical protein